jgi:hypothetical protein
MKKLNLLFLILLFASCASVFSPTSSSTGTVKDKGQMRGDYANISGKRGVEIIEETTVVYEGDLKSVQEALQKDVTAKQGAKTKGE